MDTPELDLDDLRALLLEKRNALRDDDESCEEATRTVELDQTRVGRLSRMDALQAQAMAKECDRRRLAALHRIDAALARMDSGEYGYCRRCEEPIATGRLQVDPAAILCIACASRAEQDTP